MISLYDENFKKVVEVDTLRGYKDTMIIIGDIFDKTATFIHFDTKEEVDWFDGYFSTDFIDLFAGTSDDDISNTIVMYDMENGWDDISVHISKYEETLKNLLYFRSKFFTEKGE